MAVNNLFGEDVATPSAPDLLVLSVNDAPCEQPAGATVASLMDALKYANRPGMAVAVNDEVVPRALWSSKTLRNQDRVLVLTASQGG